MLYEVITDPPCLGRTRNGELTLTTPRYRRNRERALHKSPLRGERHRVAVWALSFRPFVRRPHIEQPVRGFSASVAQVLPLRMGRHGHAPDSSPIRATLHGSPHSQRSRRQLRLRLYTSVAKPDRVNEETHHTHGHEQRTGCSSRVRQATMEDCGLRITSYNVCYTKLLRNLDVSSDTPEITDLANPIFEPCSRMCISAKPVTPRTSRRASSTAEAS